jgi:hypothetical protein
VKERMYYEHNIVFCAVTPTCPSNDAIH